MKRIAKIFTAGVLSLSMCVSPVGVIAEEEVFTDEVEIVGDETGYKG